jgi:5-methylcytosine-specific restriction endonuclease McrA
MWDGFKHSLELSSMKQFQMNHLFPEKPKLPLKKARGRPKSETPKKRKEKIPAAVYEAIWTIKMGKVFQGKCLTTWCPNTITVFDFQAGHDIPESKGGPASIENLYPICSRCNQSMGDRYTYKEWCAMSPSVPLSVPVVEEVKPRTSWWCC